VKKQICIQKPNGISKKLISKERAEKKEKRVVGYGFVDVALK
jgi:hypothetical protein